MYRDNGSLPKPSPAAVGTPTPATPTIAMVTYNSAEPLRRFFDGQLATAEALGTELVVVDNGSTDESIELMREAARRSSALTLIRMDGNRGYAAGVNAAFEAIPGRDVMLVNPDVHLSDPQPVHELAGLLRQLPRAAIVAPGLDHADGSPQPSARRYPTVASMLATLPSVRSASIARRVYHTYIGPSEEGRRSTLVDWVIGAAMLIRREAWEALGGWDERFFLYMEDADFCRRCVRAEWDVVYAPRVRLRHDYARMSSRDGASVLTHSARRRHIVSLARFFSREPRLLVGWGRRPSVADPRRRQWRSIASPKRRRIDAVLDSIS